MEIINCIAIDDEEKALDVIENYIGKIAHLKLHQKFTNPIDAISFLSYNTIDLVFLDINMAEISGIELTSFIKDSTKIIFTTAYTKYAVESYNLNALDYLLKPISFNRFLKAVNKFQNKTKSRDLNSKKIVEEFIFLKSGSQVHKVFKKDILFIKSEGNYLKVATQKSNILTLMNISKMLLILSSKMFLQVHRSYIVNTKKIVQIEKHQLLIESTLIPIGVSFRKEVLRILLPENL